MSQIDAAVSLLLEQIDQRTIDMLQSIVHENYKVERDTFGDFIAGETQWDQDFQLIQSLLDALSELAQQKQHAAETPFIDPVTGTSEPSTLTVYDVGNKVHRLAYRRINDHNNPCCLVDAPCHLHLRILNAHTRRSA